MMAEECERVEHVGRVRLGRHGGDKCWDENMERTRYAGKDAIGSIVKAEEISGSE